MGRFPPAKRSAFRRWAFGSDAGSGVGGSRDTIRSSDIVITPTKNPKYAASKNEMSVISASRSTPVVCNQQAPRVLDASGGSVRQRTSHTRGGGDRGAMPIETCRNSRRASLSYNARALSVRLSGKGLLTALSAVTWLTRSYSPISRSDLPSARLPKHVEGKVHEIPDRPASPDFADVRARAGTAHREAPGAAVTSEVRDSAGTSSPEHPSASARAGELVTVRSRRSRDTVR